MPLEEHKKRGLLSRLKSQTLRVTSPIVSSLFGAREESDNVHNELPKTSKHLKGIVPPKGYNDKTKLSYLHSGIYTKRSVKARNSIELNIPNPITLSSPLSKDSKTAEEMGSNNRIHRFIASSSLYRIDNRPSKPQKNKKSLFSKEFTKTVFTGGAKTKKTASKPSEIKAKVFPAESTTVQIDENKIPKIIRNVDMWEKQFMQMNLPGVPLQEVRLNSLSKKEILKMQKEFKRVRRDFIKYIAYNLKDPLVTLGLLPHEIELMQDGKSPENFNVHIKVPFEYGGKLDFSNLIMIPTHPYLDEIYKFIDMQLLHYPTGTPATILYIPVPNGKIFHIRGGTIISGSGGQAMGDRSVFAGWSSETLQEVSIMGLGGRSPGSIR
ncbi:MAG: hypothetical protein GY804_10780 [Alphaproteobacteria bacterium]|nr:hypothetical protein [Alphaproteobacteria bacterium]